MSDGTKSETLTAIAVMIGAVDVPQSQDEWQETVDAFAGRNIILGRATSNYWRGMLDYIRNANFTGLLSSREIELIFDTPCEAKDFFEKLGNLRQSPLSLSTQNAHAEVAG